MYKPLLCLALLFLTIGHSNETTSNIKVLTSIRPIHSLVNAVMGEASQPTLLLSGQQSPHDLILKPSQIQQLQNADIIFMINPSFETFMVRPLKSLNHKTKVIYLQNAPGISKLSYRKNKARHSPEGHDHEGAVDGHIWLDPDNAKAMIIAIATTLSKADPKNSDRYQLNAKTYNTKIEHLNEVIQRQLSPVKERPFLVFHDGYQYFEHHFDLNGKGSIVFEPNEPLKASTLQNIDRKIKQNNIQCILQDTPGNPRIIQMIKSHFNVNTRLLDPLGININSGPNLYLTLLNNMSNQIFECLSTS